MRFFQSILMAIVGGIITNQASGACFMTTTSFAQSCKSGTACCPTGETTTVTTTSYSCPSGYTMDTSSKICSRSATTGSDATGSYTVTYDDCYATERTSSHTEDCCTVTTNTSSAKCLTCVVMPDL